MKRLWRKNCNKKLTVVKKYDQKNFDKTKIETKIFMSKNVRKTYFDHF